jgi:predicted nucleotide-binding protein
MNKVDTLSRLQVFRDRLENDVKPAFSNYGSSFGHERFASWRTQFSKFLNENLPGAASKLDVKLHRIAFVALMNDSDLKRFMRDYGESCEAFIDSLKMDIQNDEFDIHPEPTAKLKEIRGKSPSKNKRVFIVHGHDELLKIKTARFIEKLGFEAVILHEQANKGMTIIEKIEANTDVGFAIVLYTGDDKGNTKEAAAKGELKERARQNVVFEHGYLIAKLTRARVVPLVSGGIELPSDISGMVYIDDSNWPTEIAKEMKSAGYDIDFNKIH